MGKRGRKTSVNYAEEENEDEVEKPKITKNIFKAEDEKRLIVVLDNCSLEIVKVRT